MAKPKEEIISEIADQMVAGLKERGVAQGLNEQAIVENSVELKKGMKAAMLQAAAENPDLFADKTKFNEQSASIVKVIEDNPKEYEKTQKALQNIAGAKHSGFAGWAGQKTIADKLRTGAQDGLATILETRGEELSASLKLPAATPATPLQTNEPAENKMSADNKPSWWTSLVEPKPQQEYNQKPSANDFGEFTNMAKALEQYGLLPAEVQKVANNSAKIMDSFVQEGLSGANGDLVSLGANTLKNAPAKIQEAAQSIAAAASKALS